MLNALHPPDLITTEYRTASQVKGPLLFVERVKNVGYDEIVLITAPDGALRLGRVMEIAEELVVVQVFGGTSGLDLNRTRIRFSGDVVRLGVSLDMLGRVMDGIGTPIDGGPPILPEASLDVNGSPINPAVREHPSDFIQTGISAIDGLNTLTRGQKLPIFSGAGLPANELAAQIAAQAKVKSVGVDQNAPFAIVFCAIGVTHREVSFFMDSFEANGAMERTAVFINGADDPSVMRLLTPRIALTAAEYLAYTHGQHVLAIITNMTNYCEALREISAAREEVPGRRGYPGGMYSDLSSIYERAGRIRYSPGSVTQLIVLTMPDDDITHPIPDVTGYITEGQIVLSRELHRKGIYPPIDVLPSLSRLMSAAIGAGTTRPDHRPVADQVYSLYARGRDLRRLVAIIGESALSPSDRQVLEFANRLEEQFVGQGMTDRAIDQTLDLAWEFLLNMPSELLTRIPKEVLAAHLGRG